MNSHIRLLNIGIIALIITMISFLSCEGSSGKACIIVPVADLVGQSLRNNATSTAHAYHTIPFCGGSMRPWLACPRLHQALFNQPVTILRETKDEVLVELPNIFYITKTDTKSPCTAYWTLKKNILPLTVLEKRGINVEHLPQPISFTSTRPTTQTIATLNMPFYDRATRLTFSAGTRFVCTDHCSKQKDSLSVYILDPKSYHFHRVALPKNICTINIPQSPQERINLFIATLRSWISHHGYIPYVWGGCSFTSTVPATDFLEKTITVDTAESSYFYLPSYTGYPKSGCDCSGLIALAAQIAGIPYYFKNTTTIEHYLPALTPYTPLAQGDLIIIPGHVMLVSDIAHNMLIEARSFIHGYGKLQEIALSKVFLGIDTYADLVSAYFDKRPIYRIDSNGTVRDTIATFKLCRMAAVFAHENV